MADPVLHIKDSYYFEVPKMLCPAAYKDRTDFPDVWVRLDPQFQQWEFDRPGGGLYQELKALHVTLPAKESLREEWQHWVHADHTNFAKPFDEFLEAKYQAHLSAFNAWKQAQVDAALSSKDEAALKAAQAVSFESFLASDQAADREYAGFSKLRHQPEFQVQWTAARQRAGDVSAYRSDEHAAEWSKEKVEKYNEHLSGKILIPQPFGTLRNLYEPASGFCISKYMVLQLVIGLILCIVFSRVAGKIAAGGPPRGYFWNLMEAFLLFIRDQIVVPSVGGGHDEHHDDHATGHEDDRVHAAHDHAPTVGHGAQAAAKQQHVDNATRLLPLFWTIFFFVLGCNLMGMIPWLGAPSASFSVTTGLALVTLVVGVVCGIRQFGLWGYLGNQIPSMDLPWYMAIIIKPLVYAIEVMGLMIKHAVLAIRLLANMVAGHLVILGIMGVAFGAAAAATFAGAPSWQWPVAATIAVIAATLFNLLELFVAFLQAYVFTFLSALFIGAALHKH